MPEPVLQSQRDGILVSNKKNKTRRGVNRKFVVDNNLRLVGCNANGISSKFQSLDFIITQVNPSIICLQETKTVKPGRIKCDNSKNYVIFELNRKESKGGGLCTMVKPDLQPVWISEGDDQVEILVVEVHIETLSIRVLNCFTYIWLTILNQYCFCGY